jgi:hypothetical protein
MKKLLILLSATILASCATHTIPVVVKLPLPPELTVSLPKIDGVALQCLSNEAFSGLVLRDNLQTQRRHTLRSIILSTYK